MAIRCMGCGEVFDGPDYPGFNDHDCPNKDIDSVNSAIIILGVIIIFGVIIFNKFLT